MKILHIITRLDRGGSADNTLLSCIGQARRGHSVSLITGPGFSEESALTAQAREEGVNLIYLACLLRSVEPLNDLRALLACRRIIRDGDWDMIHTHTSKAGILGRLAARLAGARPLVHTPHGHVFYGYFGALKTQIFIWAEKLVARWTDTIVTLTDREAEEHLSLGIGRPDQFETIFSGIMINRASEKMNFKSRAARRIELGLPGEGDIIVSVGRLEPIKGHRTLIEAFAQILLHCPASHLVLAGDGELREILEKRAEALKIHRRVHFLGWRGDIGHVLEVSDLFVLPSLNEGMGRAVVEAMAAGLAAIGTRVGGVPLVIDEGVTGLLVPPEDTGAMAAAAVQLLTRPEERKAMGEAGMKKAAGFSADAMVERLDALYQRLLSSSRYAGAAL